MIRKANIKGALLIANISEGSYDPINKRLKITKKWIKQNISKLFKNKNIEIFVYERTGVIILKKDFPGFGNCEIFWLTILDKYQKKGIGTKLVKFIEKRAKKLNFRAVYLYTHEKRKVAHKFYKKLGYKKINNFPNYYSNGDTSYMLGKMLK